VPVRLQSFAALFAYINQMSAGMFANSCQLSNSFISVCLGCHQLELKAKVGDIL